MSSLLLLPAVLLGIILFVVIATRRMQNHKVSGQTFRRAFQYTLLVILVLFAASGAVVLLGRLFGAESGLEEYEFGTGPLDLVADYELAQAVSSLVIATPIGLVLAWWIRRSHRTNPQEREALLYQTYVTLIGVVSAVFTVEAIGQLLAGALGAGTFKPDATAQLLVWGIVWGLHWWLTHRTLRPENTMAHVLFGAGIGLAVLSGATATLIEASLDMLTNTTMLAGTLLPWATALGTTIGGAAMWVVYWRRATQLPHTTGWYAYVFFFGVASGLITALYGVVSLLWQGLVHLAGNPEMLTSWLSWQQAASWVIVGAVMWWYHRQALGANPNSGVHRTYQYVVAGIASIAAATSIGLLTTSILESVAATSLAGNPVNTLWAALVLLVIATPLWWLTWRSIQQRTADNPEIELRATVRRIYLIVMVGGAGIAAVIALITGVMDITTDVMSGQLGASTLHNIRTEIAVLVVAAALIAYNAAILRQDHRVAPETTTADNGSKLTLIGPEDPALTVQLLQQFGGSIEYLVVDQPTTWDLSAVLEALQYHGPNRHTTLIAGPEGVTAYLVERTVR